MIGSPTEVCPLSDYSILTFLVDWLHAVSKLMVTKDTTRPSWPQLLVHPFLRGIGPSVLKLVQEQVERVSTRNCVDALLQEWKAKCKI